MSDSIFDFPVDGKDKKPYDMTQHRGKVLLVMNTASKCGKTVSGYTTAVDLFTRYKERGFTVLGFPCNQFGKQEPGDALEVAEFACTRFKAEFDILDKVDVNGVNASPFWTYLKKERPAGPKGERIEWNFAMFLIDSEGKPVQRFASGTKTEDIETHIKPLLDARYRPTTTAETTNSATVVVEEREEKSKSATKHVHIVPPPGDDARKIHPTLFSPLPPGMPCSPIMDSPTAEDNEVVSDRPHQVEFTEPAAVGNNGTNGDNGTEEIDTERGKRARDE